jgi:hypothetical protein
VLWLKNPPDRFQPPRTAAARSTGTMVRMGAIPRSVARRRREVDGLSRTPPRPRCVSNAVVGQLGFLLGAEGNSLAFRVRHTGNMDGVHTVWFSRPIAPRTTQLLAPAVPDHRRGRRLCLEPVHPVHPGKNLLVAPVGCLNIAPEGYVGVASSDEAHIRPNCAVHRDEMVPTHRSRCRGVLCSRRLKSLLRISKPSH